MGLLNAKIMGLLLKRAISPNISGVKAPAAAEAPGKQASKINPH